MCERIEQRGHSGDTLHGDIENGGLKPKATSLQNRQSIPAAIAVPFANTEHPQRGSMPCHGFVTDEQTFLIQLLQRGLTLLLTKALHADLIEAMNATMSTGFRLFLGVAELLAAAAG